MELGREHGRGRNSVGGRVHHWSVIILYGTSSGMRRSAVPGRYRRVRRTVAIVVIVLTRDRGQLMRIGAQSADSPFRLIARAWLPTGRRLDNAAAQQVRRCWCALGGPVWTRRWRVEYCAVRSGRRRQNPSETATPRRSRDSSGETVRRRADPVGR